MKISYDFDADDWKRYQKYHYSTSRTYHRMRNRGRYLYPIAMLFFMGAFYLETDPHLVLVGAFGAFAVILFLFYPRWFDSRVFKQSEKFMREGNMGGTFGPREIELLPDRIQTASSVGAATYRASAIVKVVESPDALLLYISSIQALVLPKQKITPLEFEQAVAFAKEHYNNPPAA